MKLTLNETVYLLAILQLGEDAYGVRIRRRIRELTGANPAFGTIYNTLDSLAKKGFVASRKGEPSVQRGGHNKVYYSVTIEGLGALREAQELQERLWDSVPKGSLTDPREA